MAVPWFRGGWAPPLRRFLDPKLFSEGRRTKHGLHDLFACVRGGAAWRGVAGWESAGFGSPPWLLHPPARPPLGLPNAAAVKPAQAQPNPHLAAMPVEYRPLARRFVAAIFTARLERLVGAAGQ